MTAFLIVSDLDDLKSRLRRKGTNLQDISSYAPRATLRGRCIEPRPTYRPTTVRHILGNFITAFTRIVCIKNSRVQPVWV